MFRNMINVLPPPPNPHAGGPLLVACPRLLIQYICNYPLYLVAPRCGDKDPPLFVRFMTVWTRRTYTALAFCSVL